MYKPQLYSLSDIYSAKDLDGQKVRYEKAAQNFREYFKTNGELRFFSAPGRTEIGGNHTDHNKGKVLAASVNLDIIAVVIPTDDNVITIKSKGFPEDEVNLNNLDINAQEKNTSAALIRGVAKGFSNHNYKIGGFKAYTESNVLKGSGLSSSAAFEVIVGTILSYLYNDGLINPVKIAQIAQYSENVYFGKPSGLMDQMASSVGGFVAIDFKDTESPVIENINVEFSSFNHALCIIDTKGDHADLTAEYSSIPEDMKNVASFFSVDCLRQIALQDVLLNITVLRENYGDRAVLRALHFFQENNRVDKLVFALKNKDFNAFLCSIIESGNSSYKFLQNINPTGEIDNQPVAIAINIAEAILARKGACRVHGGGFAGTIQAFVPLDKLKEFKLNIEKILGNDTCHVLEIRNVGGAEVSLA